MNNSKLKWGVFSLFGVLALVAVSFAIVASIYVKDNSIEKAPIYVTPTATNTEQQVIKYTPYGKVSLKVGETLYFSGGSIKLIKVSDDSRCPTGVTCIWAGTVKAELQISDGTLTTTHVIDLGKSFNTKTQSISFLSATPYPKQGTSILEKDYTITLEVLKISKTVTEQPSLGKCFVGGCSGEICSDKAGIVSTCVYRAEYACYKNATCGRQADGKCGWTKTKELNACIETATL